MKEKAIVTFEGDAHFNPVTLDPLKIQGMARHRGEEGDKDQSGGPIPLFTDRLQEHSWGLHRGGNELPVLRALHSPSSWTTAALGSGRWTSGYG